MGNFAMEQSSHKSYVDKSSKIVKNAQGYQINTEVSTINDYEYDFLMHLIRQKSNPSNPHILALRGYKQTSLQNPSLCSSNRDFVIYHESFEQTLEQFFEREKKRGPFEQVFISFLIFCISDALHFLNLANRTHGDVSMLKIVKSGHKWKLIDRQFSEGSITAYQRVLLGKAGFISPQQITKIKQGFIRQSPVLRQSDDVFAFGMLLLQLLTRKKSMQCYHESYLRFQIEVVTERMRIVRQTYSQQIYSLVREMLTMNRQQRISFKQILMKPFILNSRNRHKARVNELKQNLQTKQSFSEFSVSPRISLKKS